jgi:hypothetical protein
MSDESTRRRPSQDEPPEVTAAHRLKVTYAPGQQERQQLGDQFNQQQQRQLAGIMLRGESFLLEQSITQIDSSMTGPLASISWLGIGRTTLILNWPKITSI